MASSDQGTAGLSSEERRALLARLLREKARASIVTLPLSYGQQALYVTQQFAPDSTAYNIALAARVHSAVDGDALHRAFQTIVDRHAALRTTFAVVDDRPVQRVAGAADVDFVAVDAAGWDDAELHRQVDAAHRQVLDLLNGPLLRVRLFTRAASDHVLLMTVHHIVFDGWSMGLVLDELALLYAAETGGPPANLAPVQHQYADFVAWQGQMLAGAEGERLRDYWHSQLAGSLPVLDLPIDKPRPAIQRFRGRTVQFEFSAELGHGLRELARAEHTTLYGVVLAAYFVLLHRITGQEDLIVGSPLAGRGRPEFQKTVGYLVSPLPLRTHIAPEQTFKHVLARVRETLNNAIAHQAYPFALLLEQLQPKRDPGRTQIMEVLFTQQKAQFLGSLAQDMARGGTQGAALELSTYPLDQEEGQFDLGVLLLEAGELLGIHLSYNIDLFEHATIERMAGQLLTLLESIVAAPDCPVGALPLLPPAERELLLHAASATADYPRERCLHELIAAQATRTPDAVAAVFEEHSLSYRELDSRANRLAQHLRALGVGPDVLVGIYLHRSLDLLVALLGVLKAGCAYVPLDPAFPAERLAFMLADTAAPVLITQAALAGDAPAHQGHTVLIDADWPAIAALPDEPVPSGARPENLAYVIFTSGSTGRPKGVQIAHRAVVNFLISMAAQPGLAAHDTLVAVTTLSFDIAVLELYLPLTVGAKVVLAGRETAGDGEALRDLLSHSAATVMQATPVTWKLLLDAGWRPPARFKALCGGEAFPPELARALLDAGVELWNMYGPTETTVWSAVYPVTHVDGPLPIGRPIANTQLYVLNELEQLQPVGVAGELYIGGDGLARGYHGRAELTAERFVRDPFSADAAARMYRTGDLARLRADGLVEVFGRTDHQVKIRGFRIELGEIETALAQHAAVREAVVMAHPDARGVLRLVAYLVPEAGATPQAGQLRMHLRANLPDYMVPAAFITLESMPLTPNGKIDRRALPVPDATRARGDDGYVAPATATELAVAGVWREVLGLDRISVYDNFFDLGGHSLIAVETMSKLERQLGPKLNPALIRAQTLGQLAASYDELLAQAQPVPAADAQTVAVAADAAPGRQPNGLAGRLFGAVRRAIAPGEK